MTEMLLREIGRRPTAQVADDREAYAMCAGLALGLVTLGLGARTPSLSDLDLVDRLTRLMSGSMDAASALYEPIRSNLVMEGAAVNLAVTGPGAVLALGLMYLQTGDMGVAARLSLPPTLTELDGIRPDQIALRVACRALVLWDAVIPDPNWVWIQVPAVLRHAQDLDPTDDCCSGEGSPNFTVKDLDQVRAVYCQAVAGACLALGLRFAGTANAAACATLDRFVRWMDGLREPSRSSAGPDRAVLDDGLAATVLALALVMSGTGHLATLVLFRGVRGRLRPGTPYGLHMAVHMAIGLLFAGAGRYAAGRRPGHVAALLAAVWPRWPRSPTDNRYHVQILRHLYVLGLERRYLDTRDVSTGCPVLVPVEIEFNSGAPALFVTAPTLLPDLDTIKTIRVRTPRYWPVTVDFQADDPHVRGVREHGVLLVQRRSGHLPYLQDPTGRLGLVARSFPRSPEATRDLVRSLSADPVLSAFARNVCADKGELGTFGRTVLYYCLVRDAPDLLSAYVDAHAALVALASCPCSTLPLYQLKFILQLHGAGTAPLLQPEFVSGLRARLHALVATSEQRRLLRNWVRGGLGAVPASQRLAFSMFLVAFDIPSPDALRQFMRDAFAGAIGVLVPQLTAQFPDLPADSIAQLDDALRPLLVAGPDRASTVK